jgi:adenosylcobinamide-GDP ribazoletransferase
MSRRHTNRFTGLGDAVRTLTILPWPGNGGGDLAASLPWFPAVGLILGAVVLAAAGLILALPFPPWHAGAAALLLALEILLTRGLHLDGLADWADSIGASGGREGRLAVMKDHSIGAFGVLALCTDLLIKWAALARLLSSGSIVWLVPVFTLSRGFLVEVMTTLPSARAGQGMAGPFVSGASQAHRFRALLGGLAVCLPFGPLGLAFFMAAWAVVSLYGMRCRSRFGGITGDLLGTANEMVMLMLMIVIAFPGERILSCTGWMWVFK